MTADPSPDRRSAALSPFSARYLSFVSGVGLSSLGEAAWTIALASTLADLAGASAAGAGLAIAGVPRIIALLGGGVLADARGPRWVMIWTDAARAALMAGAAVAIFIWEATVPLLLIVAAVLALLGALFIPASGALRPRLLDDDHLVRGNALYLIGLRSGQAAGGPAGAAILGLGGLAMVAVTNAIGFLVATFTVKWTAPSRIDDIGRHLDGDPTGPISRIREGLRAAFADRLLATLLFTVGIVELSLSGPLNLGLVLISNELLDAGALGAGVLLTAFTIGATTTFLLTLAFPVGHRAGATAIVAMAAAALTLVAVGQTSSLEVAAGLYAAIGVSSALQGLVLTSLVQRASPEATRARVMSIMLLLVFASVPLGSLTIGVLVDWIGAGTTLALHAALAMTAAAVFTTRRELRHASLASNT